MSDQERAGAVGPFRADGRHQHSVWAVPPAEARRAIARFQRPGLDVAGYMRVLAVGVLALGAVAAFRVAHGEGMVVAALIVGAIFGWLSSRIQRSNRAFDAKMDEALGSDRHPCQLGREGLRLERPDITSEWDYSAIRRVAAVDRWVVVEVTLGEALVLEPKGDPAELAAWIRERAPSPRGLPRWHVLGLLALLYLGLCVAVALVLPPSL